MRAGLLVLLLSAVSLDAADPAAWRARVAAHADEFARKATGILTTERLEQRAYRIPPHPRFAIGAAAGPLYAQYVLRNLTSEYTIGPLQNGRDGMLVEYREIVSLDGEAVREPAIARKALRATARQGETAMRKRMLEEMRRLGLVDVATDYGLILLAFTSQSRIDWSDAGEAFVGTEEAAVFEWTQNTGGALQIVDGKTSVLPMRGAIWVRKSDGMPLRISATIERSQKGRAIRDDASIEYALSKALGCAAPVSVAHRHALDGVVLTENLYTYEPFRLFTTDSRIEFREK